MWRLLERRPRGNGGGRVDKWADSDFGLISKARKEAMFLDNAPNLLGGVALPQRHERHLWQHIQQTLRPMPTWVVGFCPGRQPMEARGFLHAAAYTANQWGLPLVVLSILLARGATSAQVAPCSASSSTPGYSRELAT